ncbi:hypothetical protein ACLB1O_03505 [Escherichia coli]
MTGIRHASRWTRMWWKKIGVKSVRNIYDYYKQHHYETIVMGANLPSHRTNPRLNRLRSTDYRTEFTEGAAGKSFASGT